MSAIFISHSARDAETARRVRAWLDQAGHRSVFLDFDPQVGIPAGRQWERELYAQLKSCRAVIVVLTPNWIASRWCFSEVTIARSLGKHVFPIKVTDGVSEPLLTDSQFIDLASGEQQAFERLARGLEAAGLGPGQLVDWDRSRPPYPGLPSFQEADAAVYFGREDDIGLGLDLLNQIVRFGGARFVLILGASGNGKSSLLRAALIPRLRRDPEHWLPLDPVRPGEEPWVELAGVIAAAYGRLGRQVDWKEVHGRLTAGADADAEAFFLETTRDLRLLTPSRSATLVLPIDQFEELLARPQDHPATGFLAFLHRLLSPAQGSVIVLATMRSDFLEVLQRTRPIGLLDARRLVLAPMNVGGLTQAIERPAELAGVKLGPGLTHAILSQANTDDALPLLSFSLRELYEGYAQDGEITLEEFTVELGGLNGSVARVAGALLSSRPLSPEDEEHLRRAFLSMVRVDGQGHFTRCAVRWSALPARVHPLLEAFVGARLLVSREGEEEREVEIAHEALFRAWDKLSGWLDQGAEELRLREQVREAAMSWRQQGFASEYLWSETRLARGLELKQQNRLALSGEEAAFLDASERQAKRIQRGKVRSQRFGVAFLAVVALILAFLYTQQRVARQEAERERQAALSGRLGAQSLMMRGERPDLALLLAVQAQRTAPTVVAQRSLLAALNSGWYVSAFLDGLEGSPDMIAFSPDGQRLAVTSGHGVVVYDVARRAPQGETFYAGGRDITESVSAVAFSHDARTLAVSNVSDVVTLWDLARHTVKARLRVGPGLSVRTMSFAPGDSVLATGGCPLGSEWPCDEGATYLWDLRTGQPDGPFLPQRPHTGTSNKGSVRHVAFAEDGKRLLSAGGGVVRLWDVASRKVVRSFAFPSGEINDLTLGPGDSLLAAAGENGEIQLWNLTDGRPLGAPLKSNGSEVNDVEFQRSGLILAAAAEDGTITLWNPATLSQFRPILRASSAAVQSLAFSPTANEILVSGSGENLLVIWDLGDSFSLKQTEFFDQKLTSLDATPDGKYLAVGGAEGEVAAFVEGERILDTVLATPMRVNVALNSRGLLAAGGCGAVETTRYGPMCARGGLWIWDLVSGVQREMRLEDSAAISATAISHDGALLVAGTDDGLIHTWDLATGTERLPPLSGHEEHVETLAFSPDDGRLASGGRDRKLIVWDLDTRRPIDELGDSAGTVLAAAFSPDGKLLAWGGGDARVHLWDLETSRQASPPLAGHATSVFDIAFAPSGEVLASASHDQSIVLWNLATLEVSGTLTGHHDAVTGVRFSPEGSVLHSSGRDGRLLHWDLRPTSWLELACARANRNLTASEWHQYVGSADYGKTCEEQPVHPSVIQWGKDLAARGDMEGGISVLKRARRLDPTLDLDPEATAGHAAAQALVRRGEALSRAGQIPEAIRIFGRALEIGGEQDVPASAWNALCWYGGLNRQAHAVLDACGNAVNRAPEDEKAFYRDSRGLARALTGDMVGAREDFKAFTEWASAQSVLPEMIEERESWIQALSQGTNPFDSLTLERLRAE